MGDCLASFRRGGAPDEESDSETNIQFEAGAVLVGLAIRSMIGE